MKKTITFSIAALTALAASAQTTTLPVSTTAGKKQAIIEEFTGNTCGYCPDGHKRSDDLVAQNPGKVFAINIHAGSYANPSSNSASKDFRTSQGTTIHSWSGNSAGGFPKGNVNRLTPTAPGTSPYGPGGWTMNRGYWASNVSARLNENSYVNVGAKATVNPNTRDIFVDVEAYFTAAAPAGKSLKVHVYVLQNEIIAYQGGGSSYYPAMLQTPGNNATYKHNKAFRTALSSPIGGENMTGGTTQGTMFSKTYTGTLAAQIPASGSKAIPMVLGDLDVIVFITDASNGGNVMAATKVEVTQSTTAGVDAPATEAISGVSVYPNPMANLGAVIFTLGQSSDVTVEVMNAIGQVVKSDKLETLDAGEHKYELNTTNLNNGIYFVNINVDGNVTTKKISVLK